MMNSIRAAHIMTCVNHYCGTRKAGVCYDIQSVSRSLLRGMRRIKIKYV